MESNKTIFVSIASYRDPELAFTVDTLFEKAKYPHKIKVVVCQQDEPEKFINFDKINRNIHTLNFHYVKSEGVCWARHKINSEYQHEDYFLQIDSHVAMEEYWDELITNEIVSAQTISKNQKVLLSAYPAGYDVIDNQRVFDHKISAKSVLRTDQIFRYVNAQGGGINITGIPVSSPYVNAGFMFGVGSFITDCAYDPEIYFEGEELLNTLKAYTHGYDLFNPSVHICWHCYKKWDEDGRKRWGYLHHREEDDSQRTIRHWQRNYQAIEKLNKIFQGEMPQELGTVRTINEYESYIGTKLFKN